MHKMKKRFGQNFLTDKNLLKKIVREANIVDKDVLEIGPGQGALTQFLVLDAKSVTAYEIDFTLKQHLNELSKKHENLNVIFEDILKIALPNDKVYHLVANIPYNITSPILFKVLDTKNIETATLMVQKEVADRLNAKTNTKEYNALTVTINYFMDIKKVMDVKKEMFTPRPKVDSSVIKLTRKEERVLDKDLEPLFLEIVKASFAQKRKTLTNNLANFYGFNKELINDMLISLDIDEMTRAESLTFEDFARVTKVWQKLTIKNNEIF